jgi:hypothetical protein
MTKEQKISLSRSYHFRVGELLAVAKPHAKAFRFPSRDARTPGEVRIALRAHHLLEQRM